MAYILSWKGLNVDQAPQMFKSTAGFNKSYWESLGGRMDGRMGEKNSHYSDWNKFTTLTFPLLDKNGLLSLSSYTSISVQLCYETPAHLFLIFNRTEGGG